MPLRDIELQVHPLQPLVQSICIMVLRQCTMHRQQTHLHTHQQLHPCFVSEELCCWLQEQEELQRVQEAAEAAAAVAAAEAAVKAAKKAEARQLAKAAKSAAAKAAAERALVATESGGEAAAVTDREPKALGDKQAKRRPRRKPPSGAAGGDGTARATESDAARESGPSRSGRRSRTAMQAARCAPRKGATSGEGSAAGQGLSQSRVRPGSAAPQDA